ncbi:MAG: hypothetical protein Q7S33_05225 [Nanoarchaeota archaeon]|nr:hypothetical protein [Nanoarchaeota archaeon]
MALKGIENSLNVAIDESNHGRFPEIFTAIASPFEKDIIITPTKKLRKDNSLLFKSLENGRDMRYSIISKKNYEKYGENLIIEVGLELITGLIKNCMYPKKLNVLVDGYLKDSQIDLFRKNIAYYNLLEPRDINILDLPKEKGFKPKREKTYLGALADGFAHHLFRDYDYTTLLKGKISSKRIDIH